MSWSKVKNIVIGILVVINLFLLCDIAITRFNSIELPKGTGDNFVSILEEKGITIAPKLIPQHFEERNDISVEFYNIDSLTQMFIGEDVKYVSDGQSVIAAINDKKLTVTGRHFEYSTLHHSVNKDGDDILKAIKKVGIDTKYARFIESEGIIRMVIDSMIVEGIYLDVALSKTGELSYVKGIWPKAEVKSQGRKESVISCVTDIVATLPYGAYIDDIEGIYVFEYKGQEASVKPAWRIHTGALSYVIS